MKRPSASITPKALPSSSGKPLKPVLKKPSASKVLSEHEEGQEEGEEEKEVMDLPVDDELDEPPKKRGQVPKKPATKTKEEPTSREPEPRRGKSELVAVEYHGDWTMFIYKRSTSGTPFNKFVGPDNKKYWTRSGAEKAGFKCMANPPCDRKGDS